MRIPSLATIAASAAAAAGFGPAHQEFTIQTKEAAKYTADLWALRESRATRYAKRPGRSQQQRRRLSRRMHPHGF